MLLTWYATVVVQTILLGTLCARRQLHAYRFFSGSIALFVARSAALICAGHPNSRPYAIVYVLTEPFLQVAMLAMALEWHTQISGEYPRAQRWAGVIVRFGLSAAMIVVLQYQRLDRCLDAQRNCFRWREDVYRVWSK